MLLEKKKTHLINNDYARELHPFSVGLGRLYEVGPQQVTTMSQVSEMTLRAPGGQERRNLQWFPTPATRSELYDRWRQRGIEVTDEKEIL